MHSWVGKSFENFIDVSLKCNIDFNSLALIISYPSPFYIIIIYDRIIRSFVWGWHLRQSSAFHKALAIWIASCGSVAVTYWRPKPEPASYLYRTNTQNCRTCTIILLPKPNTIKFQTAMPHCGKAIGIMIMWKSDLLHAKAAVSSTHTQHNHYGRRLLDQSQKRPNAFFDWRMRMRKWTKKRRWAKARANSHRVLCSP